MLFRPSRLRLAVLIFWTSAFAATAQADELRNWFDDPFFQIAQGAPSCPMPRGPLLTEVEMKGEAHSRIERGTSCWMAGTCKEPNAYRYDKSIAQSIHQHLSNETMPPDASLWLTVKRRFVWVEGCVSDKEQAERLEKTLLAVPDVERVIVNVMTGTGGTPPYPVLEK